MIVLQSYLGMYVTKIQGNNNINMLKIQACSFREIEFQQIRRLKSSRSFFLSSQLNHFLQNE